MPPIIMRRGLIDLSTRTPLSIARLSASVPSSHDLSLAAFTISMAESSFRHTQHGSVRSCGMFELIVRLSLMTRGINRILHLFRTITRVNLDDAGTERRV